MDDTAGTGVDDTEISETDIAVVGMAGRFPGARDVDALWRRVVAGDDCLVDLSRDALVAAGVPVHVVDDPDYVRRNGILEDVDAFDAAFFGIGQRDAAIMDPQHRHFIECCWEALETSGHVPERFAGAIGVFAGCGMNTYMLHNLLTNPNLVEQVGMFLLRHTGNDKDFLATTVSYKLDLRGPSVNVQTACSTSLVAVHLAIQSLLAFECDMVLAGGSTIEVPHGVGYTYREGEILAPDGHCRAFDEQSAGTVITSGTGVVALRRLTDAIQDRDPVLAVIKGSAINNDGQRKVGYLAPSVDGHADVVKEALAVAGLSGRDIQLLEAHGTGTSVGDPIEVAALTEAYRASTSDTGFCRLVSTKPNIGHLDTAAGVASLIKVIQALRHRTLPPLANHTQPSPLLDLPRTPFVLSSEAAPWPGERTRRAGVSSLGVGGTNAHVIVEEAPAAAPSAPARAEQLLVLSGRSSDVLDDAAARLADALHADPVLDLGDVAHTLAAGRRELGHRRVVCATDTAHAIELLRGGDRTRVATSSVADDTPHVAFMFPGGGSQYVGMAAGLDDRFDVFHAVMTDGIARVRERSGVDLAPLLRPDADAESLRATTASLPAVFLTSIALARQWMAWGVEPATFVGHSLGEYVAAHLAGVLTLDGALDLVVARSRLMGEATGAGGAMMAIPLSEQEVLRRLPASLSLATINADDECVVAGPAGDVDVLREQLAGEDVICTVIPLAAAAHSSLLDPVLPTFRAVVEGVELSPPQLPYVSNLTGTWITAEQATDPQYWVDHLRGTVRFADCLATVLDVGPTVLLELGPGHSLSSYARRQPVKPVAAIPALRHPNQDVADTAFSLLALGRAWAAGLPVDMAQFAGGDRRLVRLPGYPFRRDRHWIDPGAGMAIEAASSPAVAAATAGAGAQVPQRIASVTDSFWIPTWQDRERSAGRRPVGPWIVVGSSDDPLVRALVDDLTGRGEVVEVTTAPGPAALNAARSVVLVGPTNGFEAAVERWLTTGAAAARALGDADGAPTMLAAVTRGASSAHGAATAPADAMALGVIGTAPHEYPDLRTVMIDLEPADTTPLPPAAEASAVLDELFDGDDQVVARRGARRMVPHVDRSPLAASTEPELGFRRGGNYLVTGGLGGVGFALACHLARDLDANVVVVASRPVPEGAERSEWVARHSYDDPTSRRLRRLAHLEAFGTKIPVVTADMADAESVRAAVEEAETVVGRLDGAIHAAGELRDRPLELATHGDHEVVVGAKARGALALVRELRRRDAELLVLISSTSTVLTPEGQHAYVAANSVLDALAGDHGALHVRTIGYGLWSEGGIAATAAHRARLDIEAGSAVDHPILSERSQDRDGTVRLVGTLATDHHWVLEEHRSLSGVALLPGTGHIELLLAAIAIGELGGPFTIDAVTLFEPLVVPDGVPVTVRVSVAPADEQGRRWAQIESDGGAGAWRTHSEAELTPGSATPPMAGVPSRTPDATTIDPLALPARHVAFGPRWTSVREAWRTDEEAAGWLDLPEHQRGDLDVWFAHPALVDVATAFGIALGDGDDTLFVPVGYEAVTSLGPLPASPWVRARRHDTSTSALLKVDVVLGDPSGSPLLELRGLTLRSVDDAASLGDVTPSPSPAGSSRRSRPPSLVTLAEEHGIRADEGVEMLARALASGFPRVIASSLELDALRAFIQPPAALPVPDAGATSAGAPSDASVLSSVRRIWVDLLGDIDFTDDDDFFDVGGHSLIAIRLMARIHKDLGVRFQLATIFDAPTIRTLAAKILEARPDLDDELAAAAAASSTVVAPSGTAAPAVRPGPVGASIGPTHASLVPISTSGDKAPFFIVHGAGGNVLFLWSLARAMAGSRPIYGFQAKGIDGDEMPDATIEEMAARYVAELRAAHPGPYMLGGYSGGGIVTFEMVRQLQAAGAEVQYVVFFDGAPPGKAFPTPAETRRNLMRNIRRHGLEPIRPFLKRWLRAKVHRFIPEKQWRVEEVAAEERDLGMRDVEGHGFVNLFFYFGAAADRYQIEEPITVDAALLKAEWVWPVHAHDYHWGQYINGHLDIAEVPGDHEAMFYPENAPRLAAVLQPLLDAHEP
jgi:acyl transferase domain-containing protein/thioesterase domain-containing protein